ncbi:MAG: 30S ribosomal protein S17e [Candidatus Huberarchaeum crystalense]|uniref:30S ribosomal protein S17e n=1 Tax=Huberarchaeum crystalense TaxID=2014257 RepID=A0A2G9LJZ3_HUBC1|nr:30S ribosomal protein S17e [archaeon]OIP20270.1 MAG: hypothetical protein AUJ91_01725 [archaeon CG2_30_31_98]PIN66500.1 MAG: 30S ribosomal protein S17e [Candidatus Huberarchaeum crystalense]NCS98368.1 30S ribosomal protein S17e [archaeon]PIV13591.1 MAG: 30S ribosomal protein S17e [Candidatus Huberarchaeum crystalense]
MGNIRIKQIKKTARALVEIAENEMSPEFEKNKDVASKYFEFSSKKQCNLVVGYATHLKNAKKRREDKELETRVVIK